MLEHFSVSLRFVGELPVDFKDAILMTITGEPRPTWLRVVRLRTNGNGHTIRLSYKDLDEKALKLGLRIKKCGTNPMQCASGTVRVLSCTLYDV